MTNLCCVASTAFQLCEISLCTDRHRIPNFLVNEHIETKFPRLPPEGIDEKAKTMSNRFVESYRNWRQYRDTYNELMRLSQRDLTDLGINRVDIPSIARQAARR